MAAPVSPTEWKVIFLCRVDGVHGRIAEDVGQLQAGWIDRRSRHRLKLILVQQVIGRLVVGQTGVVDLEMGLVPTGMLFAEQAAGCAN